MNLINKPRNCMECENSHITILNGYCRCKLTGNCYIPSVMTDKIADECPLYRGGKTMQLINKSRGTGKTTQLIYASAITGFRIIAPNAHMAGYIEKMAKNMGLKIPKPMSDIEYRSRKLDGDHTPILIDEVQNQILDEALELYFGSPVVAATMTVPIDDGDKVAEEPKPLVFDHETEKVRMKTNRDVLRETFGHIMFNVIKANHKEDKLIIQTEDGKDLKLVDWLDSVYVEPKEDNDD